APTFYRYYSTILRALFEHHPELIHNFENSVFPAVCFNCGDTPSSSAISLIDPHQISQRNHYPHCIDHSNALI
ncbi:hypothetical protein B0H14DRAFT_2372034, partial [Mycena olivaceomarginata]